MENKMENEMETGGIQKLPQWVYIVNNRVSPI